MNDVATLLPVKPACKSCHFSLMQAPTPPNLQSVRVCKCLPPTPMMINTPNGAALIAVRAPVADDEFCFQFEPNPDLQVVAEKSSILASND